MRNRRFLAFAFVVVIFLGALVYWGAWLRRPDMFVIHQEVNLYPFGSLEEFLWADKEAALPPQVEGLTDISSRASRLLSSASELRTREATLTAESQRLEDEMTNFSKTLEQGRAERIEEYKRGQLASLESERSLITDRLSALEARANPDASQYDPLRVVIATTRVELAEQDVRIATKRAEVADYVLKEYGQFARPDDLEKWKSINERANAVREGLIEVGGERVDLRKDAFELMADMRSQRVDRVGFLDFLYFSIGVSTTTTFGDIIPNHTATRSVVTMQLLTSILIVGLFVNSLSAEIART